jgi:hypothetical protein
MEMVATPTVDQLENSSSQAIEQTELTTNLSSEPSNSSNDNSPPVTVKSSFRIVRYIRYLIEGAVAIGLGIGLSTIVASILIVLYAGQIMTVDNGWYTFLDYDQASQSMLGRAAVSYVQPATNRPEEAVYWQTTTDGNRKTLNGEHNYVLHFPPGGLPPNDAFWSLTMTDARGRMVANPISRYSFSSHSEFKINTDGSVDFYFQSTAPVGNEGNWLPTPEGDFKLWLRIYQPADNVLSGEYRVPPVEEVSGNE